jgi:hypothetical protein
MRDSVSLSADKDVNIKNEIMEITFSGLPIQIFDRVRKFYLGDYRKQCCVVTPCLLKKWAGRPITD